MIEPDAVIGALIGLATGIIPFIISSFWRECRERRIAKERQAERDHALEMQRLNNQRDTIRHGIERQFRIDINRDSVNYIPPTTQDPPPTNHFNYQ